MPHIGSSLQAKISSDPDEPCDVIVRVNGDMDESQRQLEAAGFQIRRKLGLIRAFATSGPGKKVRRLASEPWVRSIEEDQEIHTF